MAKITYEEIKETGKKDYSDKVHFLIENKEQLKYKNFLIQIFTCSSKIVYELPEHVLGKQQIRIAIEQLFDANVLLEHSVIAVPKKITKSINFSKEEYASLKEKDIITVTKTLDEKNKYKIGDLLNTPWGEKYSVDNIRNYRNIEDHPFFTDLTDIQKKEIGNKTFTVIWLKKVIPDNKYITTDDYYIYGVLYKSISKDKLPLSDVDGKTSGVIILTKLSESGLTPIYQPTDMFILSEGMIENYTEKTNILTTVGRFVLNYLILVKPFRNLISYINEPFNVSSIDHKVAELLLENVIGRPEYDKYMAYGFFIGQFSELCVPGMSRKSLTTDPKLKAYKEQLLKENKDKLDDPVVLAEIESKLIAMDKEYLKDDSSADFYAVTAKKSYNEARKKMFVTMGLAQAFEKNATTYTFIPGSLDDGWDPKFLPEISNEVRRGSYDRGKSTAKGGEQTKFLLRILQNLRIVESDCNTKNGIKIYLTETNYKPFIKRYIWFNNKLEMLTNENVSKFLNKEIIIRSPMYCKSKEGYCFKCCGHQFEESKSTAIGMMALDIGSRFTSISMKSMHFSGISSFNIKSLTPYLFRDTK